MILFKVFCLQAALSLGVELNGVSLSTEHPDLRAWVKSCPLGFACDNEIFLNPNNVDLGNRAELRRIAIHEVCHIKNGDHYVWPLITEKERLTRHKQIEKCVQGEMAYPQRKSEAIRG